MSSKAKGGEALCQDQAVSRLLPEHTSIHAPPWRKSPCQGRVTVDPPDCMDTKLAPHHQPRSFHRIPGLEAGLHGPCVLTRLFSGLE
jgi:hypothetical protein